MVSVEMKVVSSSSNLNPDSPCFIPSSPLQNHLYHRIPTPFPPAPPPPSFPAYLPPLYNPYYTHYSLPPPQILYTDLPPPPPPLPAPAFQSQRCYPEQAIQELPSTSPVAPSHQLQTEYVRQALTPVSSGPRFRPSIVIGPRRNKELRIRPEMRRVNGERAASNSMGKMIGGRNKFVREKKKTVYKEDEQRTTIMIKNNNNGCVMERNGKGKMIGGRNKLVRATKKMADKEDVIPLREDEQKTTIMIKNIPNGQTREMLLQLLDQHCYKENEAAKHLISAGKEMVSAYDFVYLPIDFGSKQNKGYAFVNFTNPIAVWKFYDAFNETSWDLFKSKKIIDIVSAKIQGKEGLVEHFGRSNFCCENDEYLPLLLHPPRDGSGLPVNLHTVGKRVNPKPRRMTGRIQQKTIIR